MLENVYRCCLYKNNVRNSIFPVSCLLKLFDLSRSWVCLPLHRNVTDAKRICMEDTFWFNLQTGISLLIKFNFFTNFSNQKIPGCSFDIRQYYQLIQPIWGNFVIFSFGSFLEEITKGVCWLLSACKLQKEIELNFVVKKLNMRYYFLFIMKTIFATRHIWTVFFLCKYIRIFHAHAKFSSVR
jgi:hypothetical protein